MHFEWDEQKRAAVLRDHGLDFADVKRAFQGPTIDDRDETHSQSEERWRMLAILDGEVIFVIYVEREDATRLITPARRRREKPNCFSNNVSANRSNPYSNRLVKMPRRKKFDEEAPPTQPEDWVGAAKTFHGNRHERSIPSAMRFCIFQASNDSSVFAITGEDHTDKLPPCSGAGEWRLFKTIEETGQPRVGFSEADAKAGIEEKGYYLTRVEIFAKDSVA